MIETRPLRVLWLAAYPFTPSIHGGRIRLRNLVRQVAQHGHQVDVWNVSDQAWGEEALPHGVTTRWIRGRSRGSAADKLRAFVDPLPEEAWRTAAPSVRRAVADIPPRAFDVAILEQAHLGAHLDALTALGIPCVLDAQNVESLLTRQLARQARRTVHRLRLQLDAAKFARLERHVFNAAALVASPSEEDAQRITAAAAGARVEVHRSGVDLDYFGWVDHSVPGGSRLLMTGTLGYPPNLDAALWTHDSLLPAIRAVNPAAGVALVGHSAPAHLTRLHDPAGGFAVVGQVPDVRPFLGEADIFVIPLRAGSGTRLKAVEALAAGVPIISTALGVEGLGVTERGLVLTAETPDQFAVAVRRLTEDLPLRRHLSVSGRAYVESEFDWDRIGKAFTRSLERVSAESTARGRGA